MSEKALCPICETPASDRRRVSCFVKMPYGPRCKYVATEYRCTDCDEDFTLDADKAIRKAITRSNRGAVLSMLDALGKEGVADAYLERALGLPVFTVTRWREICENDSIVEVIEPVELALLRLVRAYPGLLDVSHEHFKCDSGKDEQKETEYEKYNDS